MFIEDSLSWSYHVNYITKSKCHKIWIFKKVLYNFPDYVLPLYYNAFIRSVCSYCLMYWLNNDRSDRHKQTEKIDAFISKLVINNVHKLQCLSFMHDTFNNNIIVPLFLVHSHFTCFSSNIHINHISSFDYRNFIYNYTILWNNCDISVRIAPKSFFCLK